MSAKAADIAWMGELRERVQGWVRAGEPMQGETPAYVDLIFAFGMAKVGDLGAARELIEQAGSRLAGRDGVHRFLFDAYTFRIQNAMAGQPHRGALAEELTDQWHALGMMHRYASDRLRKHSRILEPDGNVNPYASWNHANPLENSLAELLTESRPSAFQERLGGLLDSRQGNEPGARLRLFSFALTHYAVAGAELVRAAAASIRPPSSGSDEKMIALYWYDITNALRGASQFKLVDMAGSLVTAVLNTSAELCHVGKWAFPDFITACVEMFVSLDLPEEADQFLYQVSRLVLRDRSVEDWAASADAEEVPGLRALLAVADGWYRFGWDSLANPVLARVRRILRDDRTDPRWIALTAIDSVRAARSANRTQAADHLRLLFADLPLLRDTYTSASYYQVIILEFAEALCLTAVEVSSHG